MSGHDHCAEHLIVENTNYWVNGIADGCCYQSQRLERRQIPDGSLRYLLANNDYDNEIDDDGFQVGVDGNILCIFFKSFAFLIIFVFDFDFVL